MTTIQEVKKKKEYNFILLKANSKKENKKNHSWTKEEKELLRRFYPNHSNKELSILINKTKASVDKKAHLLGLKKSASHRKKISRLNNGRKRQAWKSEEIKVIKSCYTTQSYAKIAETLNRSPSAVSQKARQLNLKKYGKQDK